MRRCGCGASIPIEHLTLCSSCYQSEWKRRIQRGELDGRGFLKRAEKKASQLTSKALGDLTPHQDT